MSKNKTHREKLESNLLRQLNTQLSNPSFEIKGKSKTRILNIIETTINEDDRMKAFKLASSDFESFDQQVTRIKTWCYEFLENKLEKKIVNYPSERSALSIKDRGFMYLSEVYNYITTPITGLGLKHDSDEALAALILRHIDLMYCENATISGRLQAACKLGETAKVLEIYSKGASAKKENASKPRSDKTLNDFIDELAPKDGTYKELWNELCNDMSSLYSCTIQEDKQGDKKETLTYQYSESEPKKSIRITTFQNKLTKARKKIEKI
ncbi:hypothetical protein [Pseudoalteromonas sp.]|uniref:hypothetical protein n=1 Tax=Pseudoalteromonas sp. TaxID=53249 RepID=UPI00235533D4|nr:hypothetical protein [Pseudoalteromonas sp.]